ncbi:MAG: STAS domain-containing protein [Pseudomonadota bacterium]|jgi:anti-anti-sigma factor
MLDVQTTVADGIAILVLSGRIDAATSDQLDFAAEEGAGGARRIVLDLAQIRYVSSAGLRVCLMIAKRLQKVGGKLALCSLSDGVREVFDIAGFSQILTITPDRDSAIEAVR